MWGGLSIGYTYPPLRAEPSKAGETGSRSVWMKKKKNLEYIYNVLNRHESHPVVTTDRLGTSPREQMDRWRAQSPGGIVDEQIRAQSPNRNGWAESRQSWWWTGDRQGMGSRPSQTEGRVGRWVGRLVSEWMCR